MRSAAATGLALALLLAGSFSWAQPQAPPAAELAGRLGCFACHSLKGPERKLGASLDGVGARLTPRELETAITFPRRLYPGAKMPSYAYLPAKEQQALVKYLESLK